MSTAKRCQFYYESHQFNKKCTKINSDSKHNSSSSRQRTTEFIISLSNGANLIIILIFGALIMVIVMIITAKIIVKCKRRKVHYNNKIHDKNKVQNINSQEKLIQLNLNNHKPDRLFDDLLLMEKANESLYLNLMNFNELSNKSTDKSSSIMSNTTIETIVCLIKNYLNPLILIF